jgi:hypothetical protein
MPVAKSRKARHLVAGVTALALGSAVAVAAAVPASAQETFELPAGTACDFGLRIVQTGGKRVIREFRDQNGNLVRVLQAGKGFGLTFTNLETEESIAFPSNGSVSQTRFNADGSSTVQATGHNVVIFFPTDVPAGPSTTLYTGRLVYDVSAEGVFTLQSVSGRTTDICALLAGN